MAVPKEYVGHKFKISMKEKYYRVASTISRWKVDTPFENWLGQKADTSEFWKKLYVFYYAIIDRDYYKKSISLISREISRQIQGTIVEGSMGGH